MLHAPFSNGIWEFPTLLLQLLNTSGLGRREKVGYCEVTPPHAPAQWAAGTGTPQHPLATSQTHSSCVWSEGSAFSLSPNCPCLREEHAGLCCPRLALARSDTQRVDLPSPSWAGKLPTFPLCRDKGSCSPLSGSAQSPCQPSNAALIREVLWRGRVGMPPLVCKAKLRQGVQSPSSPRGGLKLGLFNK